MRWARPTPLVGDESTAAERAADPTGWALSADQRDGLAAAIRARRDVRRFRPDDVDPAVLNRVLAAGHAAPSVGHSQPWRFLVVRSGATREAAAVMADRQRLRQAAALRPEDARQLLALRLEGLREAPVGIVVCCDRRVPAVGVLGRASFTDTDLWSASAAIQNIWLTARAEGLGLGWVTLFDPNELAGLLGLPPGVETLGWLCVGWPDERPPEPGLERAGWSTRLPLEQVVLYERWLETAAPEPPPNHAAGQVGPVSGATPQARVRERDSDDTLLTVPGALGVLGDVLATMAALPDWTSGSAGVLVVAAADHPVAGLGVSAYPVSTTREVATAMAAGQALGAVAARAAGLELRLLDGGVAGGPLAGWLDHRPQGAQGDLASSDALTAADVERLVQAGELLGAELAGYGLVALGEIGIGNTTVAAALTAALTGAAPAEVVGRGAGSDSAGVARKLAVLTQALARTGRESRVTSLDRPSLQHLLAELGGGEVCLLTGLVLGAARAGVPVVLDGLLTSVAALIAVRHDPGLRSALVAGQRSSEPAHALVLTELGLEPLLDLRLRAGEGVGAALAVGLLRAGQQLRSDAGRTA